MDNAALAGVVMGHSVPLVCDFLAASVGGCGNGGFAFAPADNADITMVDGYGYHLPDRITRPAKMVQTPTAGVLFLWVCRDSRVSGARGAAPCCGKVAISERGESSLCGDEPSAERTRPQGCISAPFVPKGLLRIPVPGSFFQKLLCWLAHQGKP